MMLVLDQPIFNILVILSTNPPQILLLIGLLISISFLKDSLPIPIPILACVTDPDPDRIADQ